MPTVKSRTSQKKPKAASMRVPASRPKNGHGGRVTKTADNKGRVALGGRFANRAVIVEQLSDTEVLINLARVIPEREAWLYDNPAALKAVRCGLAQARAGDVGRGPDLRGDANFAARLED